MIEKVDVDEIMTVDENYAEYEEEKQEGESLNILLKFEVVGD